jgi:type II secretory pathway pseudopilin PulG
MLVVITIIGILAGLVTGVAIAVRVMGRQAVVTSEIGQIDMALKQYKSKVGEYPPDGASTGIAVAGFNDDANNNGIPDSFERHFARRFPRADLIEELHLLGYPRNNANARRTLFANYSPVTALVFWMGGMPEPDQPIPTPPTPPTFNNSKSRLIGFSQNPVNPLTDFTSQREKAYFDFDSSRLAGNTNQFFRSCSPSGLPEVEPWASTLPAFTYPHVPAYVYFRAEAKRGFEYFYDAGNAGPTRLKCYPPYNYNQPNGNPNLVRPYWDEQSKGWINPEGFQILFGGFDGKFGASNIMKSRQLPPDADYPYYADWKKRKILLGDPDPSSGAQNANDGLDDQSNFVKGTMKAEIQ